MLGAGDELLLARPLLVPSRLFVDRAELSLAKFVITGGVKPPPWIKLSFGMLLIWLNNQGLLLGALVGVVPVMVDTVEALVSSEGANVDMSIRPSDSV